MNKNSLTHYGVLGMKWGIRRYEPYPSGVKGTYKGPKTGYTKRYEQKISKYQQRADSIARGGKTKKSQKQLSRLDKKVSRAQQRHADKSKIETIKRRTVTDYRKSTGNRKLDQFATERYKKQDVKDQKILNSVNSKKTSKAFNKQAEKYKQQGMSENDAKIAAYKNIRMKKILAAGATAAAVAGGYKAYKDRVDTLIKPGETLQRVANNSDKGLHDAFYATRDMGDNKKYRGLYGKQIQDQDMAKQALDAAFENQFGGGGLFNPNLNKKLLTPEVPKIYNKGIEVKDTIKKASPHNAKKAFNDMMKTNPEFAKLVNNTVNKDELKGKNLYETFNRNLVRRESEGFNKAKEMFYDTMKEKGYNAIEDINDKKYSGYKAKDATIYFDVGKKLGDVAVSEIANVEINNLHNKEMGKIITQQLITGAAKSVGATVGAAKVMTTTAKRSAISNYKKNNPGTKMTDKEIERSLGL